MRRAAVMLFWLLQASTPSVFGYGSRWSKLRSASASFEDAEKRAVIFRSSNGKDDDGDVYLADMVGAGGGNEFLPSIFSVGDDLTAVAGGDEGSVHVWESLDDLLNASSSYNCSYFLARREIFVFLDDDEADEDLLRRKLSSLSLTVDSLLFLISSTGSVTEAFKYSIDRERRSREQKDVVLQEVADRDQLTGLWERRTDWGEITVRTVMIEQRPLAAMEGGTPVGIFPEIFEEIRKVLGFNYTVRESVDGTWGKPQQASSSSSGTVSYSGKIGMLMRGEADMSATFTSMTAVRQAVIDYSHPVMMHHSRLFALRAEQLRLNYQLLMVFAPDVWLLIGTGAALLLVAWVLVHLASCFVRPPTPSWRACQADNSRMVGFDQTKDKEVSSDVGWRDLTRSVQDSVALIFRFLLLIGYALDSRVTALLSAKALLVVTGVLTTTIFTYFRGGLLSKLAIRRPTLAVSSLEDLLESDYRLATMFGGGVQSYFERAPPGSLQRRVWEGKDMAREQARLKIRTNKEGFDLVRDADRFIYFANYLVSDEETGGPCQMQPVGPKYFRRPIAFAMQKGSPIKPAFDHYLIRLKEKGVLNRIAAKWIPKVHENLECPSDGGGGGDEGLHDGDDEAGLEGRSLGFGVMFGVFVFLFLGLAVAVACLTAELVLGLGRGKKDGRIRAESKDESSSSSVVESSSPAKVYRKRPPESSDIGARSKAIWKLLESHAFDGWERQALVAMTIKTRQQPKKRRRE